MPKRAKRKKKGGEYFNSVKKRREKSSSNTHIHVHTPTRHIRQKRRKLVKAKRGYISLCGTREEYIA